MPPLPLITALITGALCAYLIFFLLNKSKNIPKKDFDALSSQYNESAIASRINEERANTLAALNKELSEKLSSHETLISQHIQKIAELSAQNTFLNEKLTTQKTEFQELQKTAHLQFEQIANKLFEDKSIKFTETNKINIESLLNPLKEDINKFKTKVEETYDKESKIRFSLDERVRELIEQTNKVSAEANNLATALKGKPQKRGNWGEVILERILEQSGLRKDSEYSIQQSIKDEEGNVLRPDVQVTLPDERVIIIDSKLSLVAYDKFCATEDAEEQKFWLGEHLRSTYTHIEQLSAKRYDNLNTSLDFTMMFVPVEPAYLLAIQGDPNLWADAYDKRILLVSPTTLIACLKLFSDLWRREWQNKHAMSIVKAGEMLYDKFVGFTQTFEEIGKSLRVSQEKYDKAVGQLKEGRGNLVGQAIRLKELGLKSEKKVPSNLLPINVEDYEFENDSE